ncbi:MAG: hypothetical protein AAGE52_19780 [Myxococcota bacterium]
MLRRQRQTLGRWIAVLALATASQSQAQLAEELRRPLTRAEREMLESGETVARAISERRGNLSLMGGTSYQIVNRLPSEVWAAMTGDSSDYRNMLPKVEAATEVDREGDSARRIRFEHHVGPVRARYVMRFSYDPRRRIVQFRLDESEPHTIRAGWGFIRIRSWSDSRTLVSFGTMVDIGQGLVTGVIRPTLHHWILRIPWTIKRHLERRRRQR